MSSYRIVCTEQTRNSPCGHILAVGTGVDGRKWSVREVWVAMDMGHRFYTFGGGRYATVEKYRCPCGSGTLRSGADATTANNLDSLRMCRWKAA